MRMDTAMVDLEIELSAEALRNLTVESLVEIIVQQRDLVRWQRERIAELEMELDRVRARRRTRTGFAGETAVPMAPRLNDDVDLSIDIVPTECAVCGTDLGGLESSSIDITQITVEIRHHLIECPHCHSGSAATMMGEPVKTHEPMDAVSHVLFTATSRVMRTETPPNCVPGWRSSFHLLNTVVAVTAGFGSFESIQWLTDDSCLSVDSTRHVLDCCCVLVQLAAIDLVGVPPPGIGGINGCVGPPWVLR